MGINDHSGLSTSLAPVPEGWRIVRLKHLASLRSGDSITSEAIDTKGEYPVYGGNGLRGFTNSFNYDGDYVLIGRQGALCGNVNYAHGKFWASEHAVVVRPTQDLDYIWLGETLRSMNLNQYSVSAAQPGLAVERIRNLYLVVAPIEEQHGISRCLRTVNSRINRLIRNKRRLIALLTEQKQEIIQQAVTRGLDPDVLLKPSGVEWLGAIPAHWEVAQAKRHYSIRLGKMHQGESSQPGDQLVPYLKSQHVQWFAIRTTELPEMWASANDLAAISVSVGDLLVCEGGEAGRGGIVHHLEGPAIIEKSIHRVRPRGAASVGYLSYVLRAIANAGWFDAINSKSTIAHFTREKFERLPIPCPPAKEQEEITTHIHRELTEVDRVIDRINLEINLILEYRTRLIADVVTGQIDVRELAASLPADVADAEPGFLEPADAYDELGETDDVELPDEELVEA